MPAVLRRCGFELIPHAEHRVVDLMGRVEGAASCRSVRSPRSALILFPFPYPVRASALGRCLSSLYSVNKRVGELLAWAVAVRQGIQTQVIEVI